MTLAKHYDVALSFAGEDRTYAEALAGTLVCRGVSVFYDNYEKATLWGKDLYTYLSDLYQNKACYCVMFLSQNYAAKLWTNHERKAAQARAFGEHEEYILPVRLDDTTIPGILPTIGYLSWPPETPETIADAIMAKLGKAASAVRPHPSAVAPPSMGAPQTPLHFFRPVRVRSDWIEYADGKQEKLDNSDSPFHPRRANPDSEAILAGEGGWFECVAGLGQGKTVFAYHLIRRAHEQDRAVFYRDTRDAKLPSEEIAWPSGLEKSRALVALDNVNLFEDTDIRPLANSLPIGVTAVAFSRAAKITIIRPLTCQRVELDPRDVKSYLLESEVAQVACRDGWYPMLERIADKVENWEEAQRLLEALADDHENVERELDRTGSLAGYLGDLTFCRLNDEGLIGDKDKEADSVGKEMLSELSSFSFLDLNMTPAELNATSLRGGYFQKLIQNGWVPKDRPRLKHPKIAERVLWALNKLDANNRGAPVGRILANVLIRSQAERERLEEVRRHARYGQLPSYYSDLLDKLYDTLLKQPNHNIPLDLVYIDRGSQFRRKDQLNDAIEFLEKVSRLFRTSSSLWRYERAYVSFMLGTAQDLADAGRILSPDLQGDLSEDRFINRGLYAKILARQGHLREADELLGQMLVQASSRFGEETKRWAINAAVHYCEFGAGLVAHKKLLPGELDNRFKKLGDDLKRDPRSHSKWFDFIDALRCAVKQVVKTEDAKRIKDRVQTTLNTLDKEHTEEQKASVLALVGAASEVLQDPEAARDAYQKILGLRPELDNCRGISWAQERKDHVGEKVGLDLLTALVKTLYPLRPDIPPTTDHPPSHLETAGTADATMAKLSTAMNRNEILDALDQLLPAQFERLVIQLNVPRQMLSPQTVPQAIRAGELVQYFEQPGRKLATLAQAVKHILAGSSGESDLHLSQPRESVMSDISEPEVSIRTSVAPPVDFVIVTALEEERDAVLVKLPEYRQLPPAEEDIRVYFWAELPATLTDGSKCTYRVVVVPLLGMGRVQAATVTGDAIRRWRPRYVFLVGIAGGFAANQVSLGDVLVSDQIVDYELQKLTVQGPEVRWEVHRADPRLKGAAINFLGNDWQKLVATKRPGEGTPKRHIGPIASGDKIRRWRCAKFWRSTVISGPSLSAWKWKPVVW